MKREEILRNICNDLQNMVEYNEILRADIEEYFLNEEWKR